jgi:2',3'-cyclic-nucleotide 2'-phosphodiesterase (5'-nucleotidase family)
MAAAAIAATLAAIPAGPATGAENAEKKLTFLYTTDIHAHYLPEKDERSGELHGGIAALDAKVREIRQAAKNPVFLFDSGDVSTGHPISDLEQQGVLGGALFRMMNALGYDAWCIGNHDFDHGRANVAKMVELLKFPTLSANLTVTGDPPIKIERWRILEKDGVKVGVFGLMSEHLLDMTVRDRVQGIGVGSCAAAAREAVAALTSKCDVIVALSHCGSDEDIRLVDEVSGIDLILSGHNHRSLRPKLHGKTIVAEGQKWAGRLGRLDITVRDGHIVEHSGELLTLEPKDAAGELKTILDEVHEAIGQKLDEVLAKLEVPWKADYHHESNIGDFFAEAIRARTSSDVAFLNSGGIRKNLATGNVTLGDVDEIFPFDNEIVTFEITGADLLRALEQNANATVAQAYGVLQLSGVRYEFKRTGSKTASVSSASIGSDPVDPKKTYRCAAIDFLAVDQHEKYFGKDTTISKLARTGILMTKVAEDYVRDQGQKGPIKIDVDGRMREAK